MYTVYIWFWPTLVMCVVTCSVVCSRVSCSESCRVCPVVCGYVEENIFNGRCACHLLT